MKCPNCAGDVAPAATSCGACGGAVPVATAAPATSGQTGWGTAVKDVKCEQCGANLVLSGAASSCTWCGSAKVVEAAAAPTVRPDYVVPFKVDANTTADIFRKWIKGLWFAPGDLKAKAQAGDVRGVYLPYWSFDVDTFTWYDGEIGKDRQVDESYTEKTADGKTVQRMRKVTKTDWSPTWGWMRSSYKDLLVLASKGLDRTLLKRIEPFEMKERASYSPDMLAGREAERYAIDSKDAWEMHAKPEVLEKEKSASESKVRHDKKADRARNLRLDTRFSRIDSRHLLLPVYVSAYQYNGKTFQFAINGQTGRAHGERPTSAVKVAILVAVIIAAIVGIVVLASRGKGPEPVKADAWTTRAGAKELRAGEQVTGYTARMTDPDPMASEKGSWYKVTVGSRRAMVRLDPVTGGGADVDVEVEDASGSTLGWGRRASGPEEVEVEGGVLYIRVHYWNGKADLFEYKLKVEERR